MTGDADHAEYRDDVRVIAGRSSPIGFNIDANSFLTSRRRRRRRRDGSSRDSAAADTQSDRALAISLHLTPRPGGLAAPIQLKASETRARAPVRRPRSVPEVGRRWRILSFGRFFSATEAESRTLRGKSD